MHEGSENDVLMTTLKRVAAVLKQREIPFALSGSFAAYARGAAASSPAHDVDFTLLEEDIGRALDGLCEAGMSAVPNEEDWLAKVRDGTAPVDLIHRPSGVPVTREMLGRATPLNVDSVLMPVLAATDQILMLLRSFCEHECDFGGPLLMARALREQVDWERVHSEMEESPYARAFLYLLRELNIIGDGEGSAMPEEQPQYKVGRLRRALAEDPRTSELGIGVQVRGLDIHLSGEVGCADRRRAVVELAEEVMPGHTVYDELTVARIDEPPKEERLP